MLKIVNLKADPDVPVTASEDDNPRSPPLLTFEGNADEDMEIMDLVTALDEYSANSKMYHLMV